MKVVALGGSAAGPNTGAGSAGFLAVYGTTSIVFDLGPGTLLELRKHIDVHALSGIVISHYHLDHVLDLGALRYLLSYGPIQTGRKIPLFVPPYAGEFFARWSNTFGHGDAPDFFDSVFDVTPYNPSAGLQIGDLTISMAPTVHPAQGWAIRVQAPVGLDFGYTADTGPAADLAGHFGNVGLLVSEATEVLIPADEPFEQRGHLTAIEAGMLASESNARMLMLTHMWEEDGFERAASDAAQHFGGPIVIARPGVTVYL